MMEEERKATYPENCIKDKLRNRDKLLQFIKDNNCVLAGGFVLYCYEKEKNDKRYEDILSLYPELREFLDNVSLIWCKSTLTRLKSEFKVSDIQLVKKYLLQKQILIHWSRRVDLDIYIQYEGDIKELLHSYNLDDKILRLENKSYEYSKEGEYLVDVYNYFYPEDGYIYDRSIDYCVVNIDPKLCKDYFDLTCCSISYYGGKYHSKYFDSIDKYEFSTLNVKDISKTAGRIIKYSYRGYNIKGNIDEFNFDTHTLNREIYKTYQLCFQNYENEEETDLHIRLMFILILTDCGRDIKDEDWNYYFVELLFDKPIEELKNAIRNASDNKITIDGRVLEYDYDLYPKLRKAIDYI